MTVVGPRCCVLTGVTTASTSRAIDYSNPDDAANDIKHLRFVAPQVVMITPEEVINYDGLLFLSSRSRVPSVDGIHRKQLPRP
jgi:hypothetical protein